MEKAKQHRFIYVSGDKVFFKDMSKSDYAAYQKRHPEKMQSKKS